MMIRYRMRRFVTCVSTLFLFSGGIQEGRSAAAADSPVPFTFRYAYFPSSRLIRVVVAEAPEDAATWRMNLLADDGDRVLKTFQGNLPLTAAGLSLGIPALDAGSYTLEMTLLGGGDPVTLRGEFKHGSFPWEDLGLGLDDVLVPPFEPLALDRDQGAVSCILRRHVHGEAGLWRQVESQDRPLLAAPLRLEAVIDGKTVVARGETPRFEIVTPTRVAGMADWSAGGLEGSTTFTYDYDGLTEFVLHLNPSDGEVTRLQLVIPMRTAETWLMHPVTGGLRQHFAGRIPEGEGKVWDSSGVPRGGLMGTFIPYMFVGGPERGICFAADNDRDWITDPEVPAMEIERVEGTVNLRLNLIARPARLTRSRTIRFGLQATPAKPMPEEPHHWRKWRAIPSRERDSEVALVWMGATRYWGALRTVTDFYPAYHDYSFWEQLARYRRTGREGEDPGFMDAYLKRLEINRGRGPLPDGRFLDSITAHYQWGLRAMFGAPRPKGTDGPFRFVIPFTNPRAASEDDPGFETYLDEWSWMDIADARWRPGTPNRVMREDIFSTWYGVGPTPSNIDRMLYYHRKMYETFADGIYWDNFYLQPSSVPPEAGGPGYVDDEGNLRQGVDLMALRNLVRRNAVMMHVMGMRPLSFIHMTNVNVVPMLSFGTLNLEWEWTQAPGVRRQTTAADLQARLGTGRDTALILAQSLGLQAGNISIALDLFTPPRGGPITREWVFRTVMAVCLPHEVKFTHPNNQHDVSFILDSMADFGYGTSDCRVYRYWEPAFPLTTEGANVRALVLARGNRIFLAIGHLGDKHLPDVSAETGTAHVLETPDAWDATLGTEDAKAAAKQSSADAAKTYRVRLRLDLEALGLPDNAQAFDVEFKAGREKAAPPLAEPNLGAPSQNRDPAGTDVLGMLIDEALEPARPDGRLERVAPGVFDLWLRHHDFALIEIRAE